MAPQGGAANPPSSALPLEGGLAVRRCDMRVHSKITDAAGGFLGGDRRSPYDNPWATAAGLAAQLFSKPTSKCRPFSAIFSFENGC
jgi:hypothetical protein